MTATDSGRRLGVAIVGFGGAVATTAVAGIELMRQGRVGTEGLPLADLPPNLVAPLAAYDDLVFAGWDLNPDDLAAAARHHNVLDLEQYAAAEPTLREMRPWPAAGDIRFCRGVDGAHRMNASSHRASVESIRTNLQDFRERAGLDGVVVVNLASTESWGDPSARCFHDADAFEASLDADDPVLGPAMLYAYAAIGAGVPYVNFTPSVGCDIPVLTRMAERRGVPIAGKDGKTGQTMIKTVIAPALRARSLHVDGWFSTNILGNRDGEALRDKDSLASKLGTKGSVLDRILGYKVDDHVVDISYYRPRGDNKEAWDNIDITGFLGQRMQLKLNFLCRDSILAAPLVIELARLADLARVRGQGGVQEHLGVFFKQPMTVRPGGDPEHALHVQQQALMDWLAEESLSVAAQ